MKLENMTKKQEQEIIDFIEKNRPEVYWDYRDRLSKEQVLKILEKGETWEVLDDLYEINLDYIFDMEDALCNDIQEQFDIEDDESYEIRDYFLDHIQVDMNFDGLINNTPDLLCFVKVYSNYDCATSYSDIDDKLDYLGSIWRRVKSACKKDDFLNEFANSYTASLFCFAFKTDLKTLLDLRNNFKESITIPKGTQFGFFSSFNGSGSMFEAMTVRDITMPKVEPDMTEYDGVGIVADLEQSYSFYDVYGQDDFIDDQNITVG
jgi:hypothetical protein